MIRTIFSTRPDCGGRGPTWVNSCFLLHSLSSPSGACAVTRPRPTYGRRGDERVTRTGRVTDGRIFMVPAAQEQHKDTALPRLAISPWMRGVRARPPPRKTKNSAGTAEHGAHGHESRSDGAPHFAGALEPNQVRRFFRDFSFLFFLFS